MDNKAFLAQLNSFESLCKFVQHHDVESIISIVSGALSFDTEQLAKYPMGGFTRLMNNDGGFCKGNGCYAYTLLDVKQHLNEYKKTYALLCDDISREVFLNQIQYRIIPLTEYMQAAYALSAEYSQYFAGDIFQFGEDEVIVDCGGYIGDTAEEFIKHCANYKRIYVYEPLLENYNKCCMNLLSFDNIVVRHAGVGQRTGKMVFSGDGSAGSFLSFNGQSVDDKDVFDVISLDDDINEPVTFIKMDVECFEPDAIRGSAKHIKNDSPKLAICLYHMVSDLWEIPKIINDINPRYDFYLRHYHEDQNWEYVLYAIPGNGEVKQRNIHALYKTPHNNDLTDFLSDTGQYIEQLDGLSLETAAELYDLLDEAARAATLCINDIDPELRVEICDRQDKVLERVVDELPPFEHAGDPIKIFTPAVTIEGFRRWANVELMKDCGLSVYMLAKELGAIPTMFFGSKPSDYPYLSILPGMEMLYHDSDSGLEDAYREYLINNYSEMDILVFYGLYNQCASYLDVYRKLRPDGKVYCALDMNSSWMNNLVPWNTKAVNHFTGQCDILATSCRGLRDEMNRKPVVHFPCRWFTNGFYNPTDIPVIADLKQKENVIITVGRIGTFQKKNEELLASFAKVSNSIGDWSLRLIGPVEPEFQSFINNYFTEFPKLKERVIFTGALTDKAALYDEYSRAKIFALSSVYEGFPNVYAEALFHGCMFVTSDIDAADDMTNYGELGVTYTRGDVEALSSALIETCKKADKKGMQQHIPKALAYANKYYDWNRNAKKLAYMLFK